MDMYQVTEADIQELLHPANTIDIENCEQGGLYRVQARTISGVAVLGRDDDGRRAFFGTDISHGEVSVFREYPYEDDSFFGTVRVVEALGRLPEDYEAPDELRRYLYVANIVFRVQQLDMLEQLEERCADAAAQSLLELCIQDVRQSLWQLEHFTEMGVPVFAELLRRNQSGQPE